MLTSLQLVHKYVLFLIGLWRGSMSVRSWSSKVKVELQRVLCKSTVVIGMASQHPYTQLFSEEATLNIKYLKLDYKMPCLFSLVKLKLKMISEGFSCPSLNLS